MNYKSKNIFYFKCILSIFIILNSLFLIHRSFAIETPAELKKGIEDKSKELSDINTKINQAEQDLKDTENKSKSLQNELKKADYTINQVNLSVKSSELNIQKLNLEIEALKYDIGDTESRIDIKKLGIAELLRELQKKDMETVLIIILKNKSIAESLNEAQNILNINSGLSSEVSALQGFTKQLSSNLTDSSAKKSKVELENKNLKNRKLILQDSKTQKNNLLAQTKNQEKNYQNLINELEKQQEVLDNEIAKIEDQLRTSFDPALLPIKRSGVFAWPIQLKKDGGLAYITQNFGEKSYLYKGKPHNGLDIGGPIGTPITAADDGIVVAVDNNDQSTWKKYQYGKYVLIEHKNNISTLYAHLSRQNVKEGDSVKRGDIIGYLGNTGYATGPHLHFGAYWTPSILMKVLAPAKGLVPVGVVFDPKDYL
ncbi:MAG: peptidoglycan DD-metalloendopeptidase family protein [Patescibacteria group bacterium]